MARGMLNETFWVGLSDALHERLLDKKDAYRSKFWAWALLQLTPPGNANGYAGAGSANLAAAKLWKEWERVA